MSATPETEANLLRGAREELACPCGGFRGWYETEEGDTWCSCEAGKLLKRNELTRGIREPHDLEMK